MATDRVHRDAAVEREALKRELSLRRGFFSKSIVASNSLPPIRSRTCASRVEKFPFIYSVNVRSHWNPLLLCERRNGKLVPVRASCSFKIEYLPMRSIRRRLRV